MYIVQRVKLEHSWRDTQVKTPSEANQGWLEHHPVGRYLSQYWWLDLGLAQLSSCACCGLGRGGVGLTIGAWLLQPSQPHRPQLAA